jgi:hypothetical protein
VSDDDDDVLVVVLYTYKLNDGGIIPLAER